MFSRDLSDSKSNEICTLRDDDRRGVSLAVVLKRDSVVSWICDDHVGLRHALPELLRDSRHSFRDHFSAHLLVSFHGFALLIDILLGHLVFLEPLKLTPDVIDYRESEKDIHHLPKN